MDTIGYERSISLKTIYLTIIKRFLEIILIFIPVAVASLVVTRVMIKKTYASSFNVSLNGTISAAQYAAIKANFDSDSFSYTVAAATEGDEATTVYVYQEIAKQLEAANLTHKDKTKITASEVKSGLSLGSLASNSASVTITFQASDASIDHEILADVVDVIAPEMVKGFRQKRTDLASLSRSNATSATKTSKEDTYLLIGLAAGLVLACALPFIDEILSDEVYDRKDIESLGGASFEIKASAK